MGRIVHGGQSAQVPAQNLKGPDECPIVGVWLGRGCVDFGKQLPFEGCKGKAQTDAFEHCLVKKEKRFPTVGAIVHANMLPGGAMTNGDVGVVDAAESIEIV